MSPLEPCSKTSLTKDVEGTEKSSKDNSVNRNSIGILLAIGYIIGNVIGAGVFVAPTEVVRNTNSAGLSMIVFGCAAVTSLFGALSYAEIGSMITESGADFAYLCKIRWNLVAFIFMISGCLILYPSIVAIQLQTFSEYFLKCFNIHFENSDDANFWARIVQIGLLTIIILLNFQSLGKIVARFNICASFCKIIAPISLILIGIFFLFFKEVPNRWENTFDHGYYKPLNITVAFIAALFTFDGWDVLNFGAGEMKNPRKNLPLAIIFGITLISVLILTLNASYYTIINLDDILNTKTIASTFIGNTVSFLGPIIPVVICIILIGSINSSIFAASRFLQSAAEKKYLPKFISCKNDSSDSPRLALTLHAIFVVLALFSGKVDYLLTFSGITQWCQRAVTVVALIWIRYKSPEHYNLKKTFSCPIIIPILFFLACLTTVLIVAFEDFTIVLFNFEVYIVAGMIYVLFFSERLKQSQLVGKIKKWLSIFDSKLIVIAKKVFKCVPEDDNGSIYSKKTNTECMWFEQIYSGIITTAFVAGAVYMSCPFNKLDTGRYFRRNYGTAER
uniref:AA_permease domain-containing protein n=1 Tax=Parastrongyloides trichosuri TaxID=131310 RepID=A0A0N4ZWF1_PARTI